MKEPSILPTFAYIYVWYKQRAIIRLYFTTKQRYRPKTIEYIK